MGGAALQALRFNRRYCFWALASEVLSREAATECSTRRKPWVTRKKWSAQRGERDAMTQTSGDGTSESERETNLRTSDNVHAPMSWLDLEGPNGERLILECRARHFGIDIISAERLGHFSDWLPCAPSAPVFGAPGVPGILALGQGTLPLGHSDVGGAHVVEETCYFDSENLALVILPSSEESFLYVKYLAVEGARERQRLLVALNRRLALDLNRGRAVSTYAT